MTLATVCKTITATRYEITVKDKSDKENPYKDCEVDYLAMPSTECMRQVTEMQEFIEKYGKAKVWSLDINSCKGILSICAEI